MIDAFPIRATIRYEELYKLGRKIFERLKSDERPSSVENEDNDEIEESFASTNRYALFATNGMDKLSLKFWEFAQHPIRLIVSSHKGANSSFAYQSHPYECKQLFRNVHLLSDPFVIDIEGVHIGITSTYTIDMPSKSCLSMREWTQLSVRCFKSFTRIPCTYFNQRNIPLDVGPAHMNAMLNALSNIMILPSHVKELIREYKNCICMNPERLYADRKPNGENF